MEAECKRCRPVERKMPEHIPDTPENVARAVLGTPLRKKIQWWYLSERCKRR